MLILTRKEDQSVVFPNCGIVVHVLSVKGRSIKLGFEAPKDIEVVRGELLGHAAPPQQPVKSMSVGVEKTPATSLNEQMHDLRNRLNTVTLSIHLYNNLKAIGQEDAASKTLDSLLAKLTDIDCNWSKAEVNSALDQPTRETSKQSLQSESFGGLRLLVVDDDANERELLAGVMTMKGCQCVTAASGNEALNVIGNGGEFDFALMDMHMPDLDGPSTLRAIRADPRTAKLKVFSVSGTSPSEVGAMIGGDGFDGWLPKPLNPSALWNHMQESLRRERATG